MRLLSYFLSLLFFSGGANGQPADSTNPDESIFPDIPFISLKGVQEPNDSASSPVYPFDARRKGICGEVVMAVKVGTDGSVVDAKILKSEPPNVFDKAVTEAVSKRRYRRVTFNGEPVIYQTRFPFKFILYNDDGKICVPNIVPEGMLGERAAPLFSP